MSVVPASAPRPPNRKRRPENPEQLAELICPHVDRELDAAVAYDAADLDEQHLRAVLAGESTRTVNVLGVPDAL